MVRARLEYSSPRSTGGNSAAHQILRTHKRIFMIVSHEEPESSRILHKSILSHSRPDAYFQVPARAGVLPTMPGAAIVADSMSVAIRKVLAADNPLASPWHEGTIVGT